MRRQRAEEIPGHGFGLTLEIYDAHLRLIADHSGLPYENVLAQARRHYEVAERAFPWSRNANSKLNRLKNSLPAETFLQPRALVARDAVMRVLNELVRAGRLDVDAFGGYDHFVPVYDSYLERHRPNQRPRQLAAIDFTPHSSTALHDWFGELSEETAGRFAVDGRVALAAHSLFRRPEWAWPLELRVSCPVPNDVEMSAIGFPEALVPNLHRCTYASYSQNARYSDGAAAVLNNPGELSTPASGWLALNPVLGRRLGWRLSNSGLFRWQDDDGNVMVESLWWRDGWTEIVPPNSSICTLSEGWLVLCTPGAYDALSRHLAPSRIVTAIKREYRADKGSGEQLSNITFYEREM